MTITFSTTNTANYTNQLKSRGKIAPVAQPSIQKTSSQSIMPDTSLPTTPKSLASGIKLMPIARLPHIEPVVTQPIKAPPVTPVDPALDEENPIQPIKAPPIATTDPVGIPVNTKEFQPIKHPPIVDEPPYEAQPVPMQPTIDGPGPATTKTAKGGVIICNAPETQ